MPSDFMYLHGRLFLSPRNASGYATSFVEMPSTSDIELTLETTEVEHVDKSNATASLDLSIPYMIKGSGKVVCDSSLARVIALALFGAETTVSGGSFTATQFEITSGVAVGDILPLPGGKTHASSLVITDSTPETPSTLTLGTHYTIVDADAGLIQFGPGSLASFQQPFNAAGTEAAGKGIGIFKQRTAERIARFMGINVADDDAIKVIDFYRMQFSPAGTWKVIGDGTEVQKWELPFKLLKDATKPSSATFGQFGRYRTDA